MIKHCRVILVIFLVAFSNYAFSEYVSKSKFNKSYKCISTEKGGYNHTKNGHELTKFTGDVEFNLTHISHLRSEAILKYPSYSSISDPSEARTKFEEDKLEISSVGEIILEEYSYFMRMSAQNPNDWIHLMADCYATKTDDSSFLNCTAGGRGGEAKVNLNSMIFTYANMGSWHVKNEAGYYGDSSVFAFGTCKEYYP